MAKLLVGLYVLIGFLTVYWVVSPVFADPLKSNHYEFEESTLGGTGLFGSQSANYRGSGSGSILGLGNSASSDYQINAGGTTTGDPALAFAITSASPSFGSFSPSTAATATATFQVVDYTSNGYTVQVIGNPPSNGSHTITAMSTTGPSQAGVEQFGLNLVANTSPVSLGANPNHGQFGVGSTATGYNTPDNYRYVSGETIASAPKSSGQTTYTISYIVNVTSLTPGGQYASNQTLICTGTF
jgi:hypothetical protein